MKNLKLLRQKKNVTQIRLSIAAEVSQETISAYESGKALPSAETLIKLADFLDTSVDYILDRTENSLPINYQKSSLGNELLHSFEKLNTKEKEEVLWYCNARLKKTEQK